ncbi:MAG: prephenate dehydrogenase/arogenate dehydrogenase family protein [Phycisphaerales bacterium JB040]
MSTTHPFTRTLLLGRGAFGRLAETHLGPHTELVALDRSDFATELDYAGALAREVPRADAVILAVPVRAIPDACRAVGPHVRTDRPTLIADVASVKVQPARWMEELLPDHATVLATHPCFGPETAAELGTIEGQPVAFCPVRASDAPQRRLIASARAFLADTLRLDVIDLTPDEHDRQMAHVQVLTHLVGHACHEMRLPELPTATLAYRYLLRMQHNTERDAPALFEAIQHLNPHAAEARARFRAAIDAVLSKAEPAG